MLKETGVSEDLVLFEIIESSRAFRVKLWAESLHLRHCLDSPRSVCGSRRGTAYP